MGYGICIKKIMTHLNLWSVAKTIDCFVNIEMMKICSLRQTSNIENRDIRRVLYYISSVFEFSRYADGWHIMIIEIL